MKRVVGVGMENLFVGRVMSAPVQTIHHTSSMEQAAEKMQEYNIGSIIITDTEDEYLGILTASDCIDAIADDIDTAAATVHEYLTTKIATTTVGDTVQNVAETMMSNQIHHVPVVDDENAVIGIVTTTDITAYLSHIQSQEHMN